MVILFLTLLMGCQSTKIKYKVPEIDFPEFPLAEEIIDNKDGTCTVPTEWIIQLRVYQIKMEMEIATYEEIKNYFEVAE